MGEIEIRPLVRRYVQEILSAQIGHEIRNLQYRIMKLETKVEALIENEKINKGLENVQRRR